MYVWKGSGSSHNRRRGHSQAKDQAGVLSCSEKKISKKIFNLSFLKAVKQRIVSLITSNNDTTTIRIFSHTSIKRRLNWKIQAFKHFNKKHNWIFFPPSKWTDWIGRWAHGDNEIGELFECCEMPSAPLSGDRLWSFFSRYPTKKTTSCDTSLIKKQTGQKAASRHRAKVTC